MAALLWPPSLVKYSGRLCLASFLPSTTTILQINNFNPVVSLRLVLPLFHIESFFKVTKNYWIRVVSHHAVIRFRTLKIKQNPSIKY